MNNNTGWELTSMGDPLKLDETLIGSYKNAGIRITELLRLRIYARAADGDALSFQALAQSLAEEMERKINCPLEVGRETPCRSAPARYREANAA